MTREEAILQLVSLSEHEGEKLRICAEDAKALQMGIDAIKALEQEPQTNIRKCGSCKHSEGGYMACTEECHECMWESKYEPKTEWIPVSERLPETDNENRINDYNVLLWVKNKSHPEKEPQIYLGKLRHIDGDDGSGNFWGTKTKPCDWTIWGWSYFYEPEVIAWMLLPEPYKSESEE